MKIGAVVIHSQDYVNRKQYVEKLQKFFQDTEVEFKIIDGVISNQKLYDATFEENTSLSKGQIGCSLAHLNALKTVLDMNLDYAFIFEDDVEINVDNYETLKKWLNNLPNDYDLCLITNVGSFVGVGHDGRLHQNVIVNDIQYVSCPFGTQAYYANKKIIKLLYDTQINMLNKNKIHVADGLHIHCEKEADVFLKIVTPLNNNRFFYHCGFENSIINNII